MNLKKEDVVYVPDEQENCWVDEKPSVGYWCKPVRDVFVLTKDDLIKLLDLAFTVGGAYDVQKYSGKDMMGLQNKKQFIESIISGQQSPETDNNSFWIFCNYKPETSGWYDTKDSGDERHTLWWDVETKKWYKNSKLNERYHYHIAYWRQAILPKDPYPFKEII